MTLIKMKFCKSIVSRKKRIVFERYRKLQFKDYFRNMKNFINNLLKNSLIKF